MAPRETSVIGRGAHVRGKVTGTGDLEIHGRVDGSVSVDGEATIESGALVGSNVNARQIVVRGAVKGDLIAEESIALEDGARVVGDVRAPRVAIATGALVRGYVQAGDATGAPRGAGAKAATSRVAAAPARVESRATATGIGAPVRAAAPAPAPAPVRAAAPAPAPIPLAVSRDSAPRAVTLGGGAPSVKHGPPPPVVPALKKGAKGALKKKA